MVATHMLRNRLLTGARVVLINRPHTLRRANAVDDADSADSADGAEDVTNAEDTTNAMRATDSAHSTMARGMAYGTSSPLHLLNVPAGRMSAFAEADRADDFLDYLHTQNVSAEGGSFVARHWYGAYLQHTLQAAATYASREGVNQFETRQDTVVDIVDAENARLQLTFASGTTLIADRVVLALGNFAPAPLPNLAPALQADPRVVHDPWQPDALAGVDLQQPVLLIGTGLTMFDVVVSLKARAAWLSTQLPTSPLQLHAVSRRGLWPQSHREHTHAPAYAPIHAMLPAHMQAKPTARSYLRHMRDSVRAAVAEGMDWRDVIASLRPQTPALWRALPMSEQRRFLRHVKPYWESYRHRAAPQISKLIYGCGVQGEIASNAARILMIDKSNQSPQCIAVTLLPRGETVPRTLEVGAVINCTGPSAMLDAEPLLATLRAAGTIAADVHALGILVADDYRVCRSVSDAHPTLYYVGPLLRAQHWEATAVPELRQHAATCAAAVVASLMAAKIIR